MERVQRVLKFRLSVTRWIFFAATGAAVSTAAIWRYRLWRNVHLWIWIQPEFDAFHKATSRCSGSTASRPIVQLGRQLSPRRKPLRIACIFRGQPFRHKAFTDCTQPQEVIERLLGFTAASYHEYLIEPLEALGHSVDIFLAPNIFGCAVPKAARLLPMLRQLFGNNSSRVVAMQNISAVGQVKALRSAIGLYRRTSANGWPRGQARGQAHHHAHDAIVIARFDVGLCVPLEEWSCDVGSNAVSLPSSCGLTKEFSTSCVGDTFYMMPAAYLNAFDRILTPRGAHGSRSCFKPVVVNKGFFKQGRQPLPGTSMIEMGHDCLPALRTLAPSGENPVEFCAPRSRPRLGAAPGSRLGASFSYILEPTLTPGHWKLREATVEVDAAHTAAWELLVGVLVLGWLPLAWHLCSDHLLQAWEHLGAYQRLSRPHPSNHDRCAFRRRPIKHYTEFR